MKKIIIGCSSRCYQASEYLSIWNNLPTIKKKAINIAIKGYKVLDVKRNKAYYASEWHHIQYNNGWGRIYFYNPDCSNEQEIKRLIDEIKYLCNVIISVGKILDIPAIPKDGWDCEKIEYLNNIKYILRRKLEQLESSLS